MVAGYRPWGLAEASESRMSCRTVAGSSDSSSCGVVRGREGGQTGLGGKDGTWKRLPSKDEMTTVAMEALRNES